MSIFFNGRLWVSPATMSAVNDSAMANPGLTVGNVPVLIGQSVGGKPNTVLSFGSPSEAQAVLRGGELLTAVLKCFDPSAQTGGPATVKVVRVNPALQSSLVLQDASANNVITLQSTDYGLYTNQIKVKVEAGTTTGKKLTVQFGNDYASQDNVARRAFQVQYTGGLASAQMTINGSTLTLAAPTGTTVATIDLNTYSTVQQVVDRINVVTNFTASVLDGNGQKSTLNGLDYVTGQDVKTAAYVANANLQAVVDWFNSTAEPYLTATRAAAGGAVPTNLAFTYLSGGSDGVTTNTEWGNAFTTLQSADVQYVVPVSSNPAIHAMADTHVQFMSTSGRMERRAFCGTPAGTDDTTALTLAKAINSDRTALLHLGYYDYDANGNLVLMPPYMSAALVAGMFGAVNPGTPLTNKTIKARGLERNLRNPTDTDALILGGLFCLENTPGGYKVVKSISTWLTNTNFNRVEVSTGIAVDFAIRSVRDAVDVLRGEKNGPLLMSRAVTIAKGVLAQLSKPEPQGPGVLVGDDVSPPFKNVTASVLGDALYLSFQASPAIPANYIPVTMFAVPYTGATA